MAQNTKTKCRSTINIEIVETNVEIIGKTVEAVERRYHIKFRSVDRKKAEPRHQLCLGEQIEVYGPNKHVFTFWKDIM